jgi:D-glycero-alpha-D-manno-heptose-7-phosphate kinase
MIISQTPLRISLVGGGTDLEDFWSEEPGAVLSMAIDKYVYVIVKERFDDLIYINYSQKEIVENVAEIKHDLVRESFLKAEINSGVEITTLADIPSEGSGLGSSSSIIVGLLNAFYAYRGKQVMAEQLAQEACEIEIDILGKPIGKQDQYISAYGGLKEITFNSDDTVTVEEVKIHNNHRRVFGSNILLFYTDITRQSSFILTEQKAYIQNKMELLRKMRNQVPNVRKVLEDNDDFDEIGHILHQAWELKKQITDKISNPVIDEMYQKAREAGALGGKISGAGGGGFLLVYVPRKDQNNVRKALKGYREFPFMLDPYGSRILFNVKRDYWK